MNDGNINNGVESNPLHKDDLYAEIAKLINLQADLQFDAERLTGLRDALRYEASIKPMSHEEWAERWRAIDYAAIEQRFIEQDPRIELMAARARNGMALAMRGMIKDFALMQLMESRFGYNHSYVIIDELDHELRTNREEPKIPDWKHPIPVPVSNAGPSEAARAKARAKRRKRK